MWVGLSALMKLLIVCSGTSGLLLIVRAYRMLAELNMRKGDIHIARWQRLFEYTDEQLAESENDREYSEALADYYRARSADLEFICRSEGYRVPEARPLPVKKQLVRRRLDAVDESQDLKTQGDDDYGSVHIRGFKR